MDIFKMLTSRKSLLGMNSRNLEFVHPHNAKRAVRIADNKLLTKQVLQNYDIPVPKVYAIIGTKKDIDAFNIESLPDSFVLKPNRGFGGEGIMITYARKKNGNWIDSDKEAISPDDIRSHLQDILDGRFSLSDTPDVAFFEERLLNDPLLKSIAYKGVPDIRVIVYNKVPIMAMMRLPTPESHGKANLHMGGIGLGIDIATGRTTRAIQYDELLVLPGGMTPLEGFKIPLWEEILQLAIRAQQVSDLGYLGIDIVLVKDKGPVVLELNAHPGLSIQIANMAGLKERLLRVRGLDVDSVEKGIRVAKELFVGSVGLEHENKATSLEELKIIRSSESVYVYHKNGEDRMKVNARIDSGAKATSLDLEHARLLGFDDAVEFLKEYPVGNPMTAAKAERVRGKISKKIKSHPDIVRVRAIHSASGSTVRAYIPLTIKVKNKKVKTVVALIDRSHLKFPMIIGRKDLKGFLVDPALEHTVQDMPPPPSPSL
ncbi:MAG TPA: sugar-transfer associated ATP-grasp domain-containing protein [Patescibacteria group bacterium]|nr:sugar-transfer associated ATP-grasp domain-containing protein [Patescibacteria group bacterium]